MSGFIIHAGWLEFLFTMHDEWLELLFAFKLLQILSFSYNLFTLFC